MPRLTRLPSLVLLVLLGLLAGCGGPTQAPSYTLAQLYQHAVQDARTTEAEEVSHDLTPIVPANPDLQWRDGAVLMVTWTGWTGYDPLVGQATVLSREVWTTCAPLVRGYVAAHPMPGIDRALRAKQALGLPADSYKVRFVELWCRPADMYRPALDPDVTRTTSPPETPGWDLPNTLSPTLRAWYTSLRASSYGPNGYPWTRLGYTYDWADPRHEEGLSEFVVRPGARVTVNAVHDNAAYLN
ncbi:MAG: hypothetical protein HZB16_24815 [Armatimonadetes bacterium]|nr:hypothetical protein [Armatimonadota bacterium]